jgi:glycosyltransferase involved in cell wall biosynthesis
MVARFAPQKDHFTLLRALAAIDMSFRLTLVGNGPTRAEVMREAARLNLNGRVEFTGARENIAPLLADSDAFVLSTNWEGFPLTIIEGMRAGLPVIATDVDGVKEAVVEGETGFIFPRKDVSALESCIRRILTSPSLRASMGKAGRDRFEALFSLAAMVQKTWGVYRDVLLQVGSGAWHETAASGGWEL